MVKTKAPVFDEIVWAWKVRCEYSYHESSERSAGGRRLKGSAYAWFRDESLVKWRDIVPPRSMFD